MESSWPPSVPIPISGAIPLLEKSLADGSLTIDKFEDFCRTADVHILGYALSKAKAFHGFTALRKAASNADELSEKKVTDFTVLFTSSKEADKPQPSDEKEDELNSIEPAVASSVENPLSAPPSLDWYSTSLDTEFIEKSKKRKFDAMLDKIITGMGQTEISAKASIPSNFEALFPALYESVSDFSKSGNITLQRDEAIAMTEPRVNCFTADSQTNQISFSKISDINVKNAVTQLVLCFKELMVSTPSLKSEAYSSGRNLVRHFYSSELQEQVYGHSVSKISFALKFKEDCKRKFEDSVSSLFPSDSKMGGVFVEVIRALVRSQIYNVTRLDTTHDPSTSKKLKLEICKTFETYYQTTGGLFSSLFPRVTRKRVKKIALARHKKGGRLKESDYETYDAIHKPSISYHKVPIEPSEILEIKRINDQLQKIDSSFKNAKFTLNQVTRKRATLDLINTLGHYCSRATKLLQARGKRVFEIVKFNRELALQGDSGIEEGSKFTQDEWDAANEELRKENLNAESSLSLDRITSDFADMFGPEGIVTKAYLVFNEACGVIY